jgi:RsiW-degrading membrane proteinase PrsW (M82 family)
MFENKIVILSISALIAAIPVAIWVTLFFRQAGISKKILAFLFFLGTLTAPALLGIQYLWQIYPEFDIATLIETSVVRVSLMYMLLFILFGVMEEIIKHFAVRIIDKKSVAIKTVNDALRLSILSALGFSFAENIYYLYELWSALSVGSLIGVYIFRSIVTMCAHMVFSGIFGYYFGISKFSIDITKQKKLIGEASSTTKAVSRLFHLPIPEAHREKTILKGLFLAMGFHAIFNFLLQFGFIIPVVGLIALGYFFLRYLLKRKVGHLVLLTDISEKQKSLLAKKDEEVVLELMGIWFQNKRYVDVIHVCERLLERDPDNNVVKLFKAKALDNIDDKNAYKKVLNSVFKSKEDITKKDKNILTKYLEEKKKS